MPSTTVFVHGYGMAWDGTYEIDFKFRSGSSDSYTSYGWEPGDPPEVEFESIIRRREDVEGEEDADPTIEHDLTGIYLPQKVDDLLYEKCCEAGEDWLSADDY